MRESFFNDVAGLRAATLLRKRLWDRCFPKKFLRAPFLTEHLHPVAASVSIVKKFARLIWCVFKKLSDITFERSQKRVFWTDNKQGFTKKKDFVTRNKICTRNY